MFSVKCKRALIYTGLAAASAAAATTTAVVVVVHGMGRAEHTNRLNSATAACFVYKYEYNLTNTNAH